MDGQSVVLLAALPPVNGGAAKFAMSTGRMLEEKGARVLYLNTAQTRSHAVHNKSLSNKLYKTFTFFGNIVNICRLTKTNRRTLYHIPDAGLGLILSFLYVTVAAYLFERVILHHQTYRYINKFSFIMFFKQILFGRRIIHIFPDRHMKNVFKKRYLINEKFVVVPNIIVCGLGNSHVRSLLSDEKINIGFLSNLTNEKGFDVVGDVFRKICAEHKEIVQFHLAGRPVDKLADQQLFSLCQDIGDNLSYYGQIDGNEKQNFFGTCDIFLFPTRFAQEAQPLVIYEALGAGCIIVSSKWAGIPLQVSNFDATLVEKDIQEPENYIRAIKHIIKYKEDIKMRREIQVLAYKKELIAAEEDFQRFFESFHWGM